MPTYDFICSECNYKQEKLVSILYPKRSKCPICQKYTLIRCIGQGGGFNLKGDGYYKNGFNK